MVYTLVIFNQHFSFIFNYLSKQLRNTIIVANGIHWIVMRMNKGWKYVFGCTKEIKFGV